MFPKPEGIWSLTLTSFYSQRLYEVFHAAHIVLAVITLAGSWYHIIVSLPPFLIRKTSERLMLTTYDLVAIRAAMGICKKSCDVVKLRT